MRSSRVSPETENVRGGASDIDGGETVVSVPTGVVPLSRNTCAPKTASVVLTLDFHFVSQLTAVTEAPDGMEAASKPNELSQSVEVVGVPLSSQLTVALT